MGNNLNIVFYYMANAVPAYAEYWMKSIRKFMPAANVIQATDMETPMIEGVDKVVRFKTEIELSYNTVSLIGFEFLSKLKLDRMIFVDPDFMFNGNLEHLFDGDYDISIATRMRRDRLKNWYKNRYPYNSLIVLKTPRFWKECYRIFKRHSRINWFSNMGIVARVVNSGKYKVRLLNGDIYNKVPRHKDDYNKRAKLFHFKGNNRKDFMKPFYENYIGGLVG
jgi:hypothetical protein